MGEINLSETTEVAGWPWPRFPRSDDPTVGVDQRTYDNLVRYTKYASGAYQVLCPRPMGNTLIAQYILMVSLFSSRTISPQRKGLSPGMTNRKSSSSRLGGHQTLPASFSTPASYSCLYRVQDSLR
ncbi:hypothetical protein OG21DRAFT_953906 [Imleria badia]|nr:hypothetical protein OG21DRAFT_953906 [Imleria badia]